MKILLIFVLSLSCVFAFGQSTLPLRADTVVIERIGGNANLKIKNSTRDTLGVLTNVGGGATRFIKSKKYNDTCLIIGRDTICGISGGSGSDTSDFIQEQIYGTIYDKNTWTDLSDFTVNNATASVVSNKINVSGGVNNYTHTLSLNSPSFLRYYKIALKARINEITGSSYGFGIGMASINPWYAVSSATRIGFTTGSATNKKPELLNNQNSSFVSTVTTSTGINASANDYVVITMERNDYTVRITARNATTNSIEVDTSFEYRLDADPQLNNSGRFTIYSFGGSFTIDSFAVTSTELKNASIAVLGDSKGEGANASSVANSYAGKMAMQYRSVYNASSGGDRTTEMLARIREIILHTPKQALIMVGSNDVRSGVADATTKAQYQAISDSLLAAGIDVYYSLPYETSVDLSALWTWIQATFPADKVINTFNTMQVPGTLAADGVHPNDTGHARIYAAIVASNKLSDARPVVTQPSQQADGLQEVTEVGATTDRNITISNNQDAITMLDVKNESAASNASSAIVIRSDAGFSAYQVFSSTAAAPSRGLFYTSSGITNGFSLATGANAPIKFHTNSDGISNERARFTGTGNLLIGTTTDNGTGLTQLRKDFDGYVTYDFKNASLGVSARQAYVMRGDDDSRFINLELANLNSGNTGSLFTGPLTSALRVGTIGSNPLVFMTNTDGSTNERARFTGDGQFLIGTTTPAGTKLFVSGTSAFNDSVSITSSTGASRRLLYVNNSASGASTPVRFVSDFTQLVVQSSSASGFAGVRFKNNLDQHMGGVGARVSDKEIYMQADSANIAFRTGPTGSVKMYITNDGRVSVSDAFSSGLSSYKLWVDGTLGVNKDSVPLVASITTEDILLIDTSNHQHKRIKVTDLGVSGGSSPSQYRTVSTVTTTGTVATNTHWIRVDASGGNITLTLPAASTVFASGSGICYKFKRIDNSGNTVTIQRAGADTIDGAGSSFALAALNDFQAIQCISTSAWELEN